MLQDSVICQQTNRQPYQKRFPLIISFQDPVLEGECDMGRKEASTMSVPQMALLLGIKKTDSYYLIKKHCFDTTLVNGQIRVVKKSFEEWYRNQTHYKKITGEEPGKSLTETSYSVSDLQVRFGISRTSVFDLMSRNYFPVIRIDSDTRRIPKEPFEAWLRTQEHYRDHDEPSSIPLNRWLPLKTAQPKS